MSEIKSLSSDARRCLWQCYELLLRLADEADEENTTIDIEFQEDQKEIQMNAGYPIAGIETEQIKTTELSAKGQITQIQKAADVVQQKD